ncbi:hypothetical protein ACFOWX_01965 [Sphingorhabdus arenilitoris]|uniref:DUF4189 domain-containing protein n=1 Tax=Sphingorhabdus arenilitoris TaxID=1490041 RepID=A0ABV8RD89_9SPHN
MTLLSWTIAGLALPSSAIAQQLSDGEIAGMIARQKQLVKIDRNGCIVDPEDDGGTIVVCGPDEVAEGQQIFGPPPINTDRIRRGEGISTERAAARDNRNCGVIGSGLGCTKLPENWIKGSYSPPYPPDFAAVIEGLPDQEQVNSAVSAAPE